MNLDAATTSSGESTGPQGAGMSLAVIVPLAVGLVALLFAATLAIYGFEGVMSRAERDGRAELLADLARLDGSLEHVMTHGNATNAHRVQQELMAEISSAPFVVGALLVDDTDVVVAASRSANLGRRLTDGLRDWSVPAEVLAPSIQRAREIGAGLVTSIDGGRELVGVQPVSMPLRPDELRPRRVGALVVRYDLARAKAEGWAAVRPHVVLTTLYILVIVAGLALFLNRRVSQRLARLVGATRKMASDGFTSRPELDGGDEIGELAAALNHLAEMRAKAESDRERLLTALEGSGLGLMSFAVKGDIRQFNRVMRDLLEGAGGDVSLLDNGRPATPVLDALLGRERADAEAAIAQGEPWTANVEGTQGSETRTWKVSLLPVLHNGPPARSPDASSSLTRECVLTARDVTRAVRMERRLEGAQRLGAIGTLAAGVAHDFNNLLTAVAVSVDDLKSLGVSHVAIEDIDDAVARGASIVRQLLDFGRRGEMQAETIALPAAVQGTGELLRRLLKPSIDLAVITRDVPAEGLFVEADASHMQQCFMNLALNARDAVGEAGELTFVVRAVDRLPDDVLRPLEDAPHGWASVLVRDNGKGMAPEVRARIFEPFFSGKPLGEGTGLGMSVVWGAVEQCGGNIAVRSWPGEGTEVEIFIRRTVAPRESDQAQTKPPASRPEGERVVLFVEDDALVSKAVVRGLTRDGFTVLHAASVPAARKLWAIERDRVAVLLSDVVLRGGSGPMLAQELRKERAELPVVLVSGYAPEEAGVEALLDENTRFVTKPFSPDAVATIIDGLLADVARRVQAPET